jgi:uncharacterized protein (DUF885 family)
MKIILVLLSVVVFQAVAQDTDLYQQTSEVNNIMIQYRADHGSLSRYYFIEGSPARRNRLIQLIESYQERMKQLPFEKLNTGSRIDYILFFRDLANEKYDLEMEQKEADAIKTHFAFADKIYTIEKARQRGTQPDVQKLAGDIDALTKEIIQATKNAEKEIALTNSQYGRAISTVKGLRNAMKSVYDFYDGYDPLFTWWIPEPYKKLDTALAIYGKVFADKKKNSSPQKEDGSGIRGNPAGRDELIRQLQYELIPYTPEELIDIANKEFAWCDVELLKASREMGFGDNWKQAQEKVKNSYVLPGKQPEAILKLYNESVDFLKKNDLITIPPLAEETWRMTMMSPERQLVSPFFLGGEQIIISYPTNTMSHADKLMSMRGNNPHFSRSTVHHELIAGHRLQFYMGDRYKAYRKFETPFWIEGWAFYWEMILWDMKFPQSPEDRIGMLFWRMHRCARIIFSLNYHLGKWSPQQCIDFLVDRVGHERANAEGEVRRSFTTDYPPLYQLAYMMGALQFYSLKKEMVDTGKMTYRQFHDAIIRENEMPVEMVRAILTNQNLNKDFKSQWKFYSSK